MARLRRVPLRVGAAFGAALLLVLSACDGGRTRLVVRTDLPREVRRAVEASFEAAAPDVDVRFDVDAREGTLTELIAGAGADADARAVPFDVWWGASSEALEEATRAGGLTLWRPLLATPFVIAFDQDRLGLPDAPRDWIDVFHHGWAEEVVLADPTRSDASRSFVGSVVANEIRREGLSWVGFEWLGRLDGQIARYVQDEREALRALRLEQASLAIVPRVDFEAAHEGDESLYFRVPESGTPVAVLGAGVAAGSAVPAVAARFLDHLASAEATAEAARLTGWEPFGEGAAPVGTGEPAWSGYPLATALVADSLSLWMERWSREVRGRGK